MGHSVRRALAFTAMRCMTCGGTADTESCESCAERALGLGEQKKRAQLAWLYTCARRALRLARTYGMADGSDGLRARGCLAQVKVYRRDIRSLRQLEGAHGMPGIAKGRAVTQGAHASSDQDGEKRVSNAG